VLALVSRRESWRTLRETSKTGATPLCIQIGALKLIRLGAATLSIYGAAVPDISSARTVATVIAKSIHAYATMTTLMRVQGTFIDVDASKARYSAASWYSRIVA